MNTDNLLHQPSNASLSNDSQPSQSVFGQHSQGDDKSGVKFKRNQGDFSRNKSKLFLGGLVLSLFMVAGGVAYHLSQQAGIGEIRQQASVGTEGWIAFSAKTATGTTQIFSMKEDNGDFRVLSSEINGESAKHVSFSPDGSKVVYTSNKSGSWNIFMMDADGGNEEQLTTDGSAFYPSFSEDGDKVVYVFESSIGPVKTSQIRVKNIGGSITPLTDWIQASVNNPLLVLGGSKLIFSSSHVGGVFQIFSRDIGVENSGINQLTTTGGKHPSMLDNHTVLFISSSDGVDQIFSIGVDGENFTQLTFDTTSHYAYPVVSPDGTHIAYVAWDVGEVLPTVVPTALPTVVPTTIPTTAPTSAPTLPNEILGPITVNGNEWYLGVAGQNCDDVCGAKSKVCSASSQWNDNGDVMSQFVGSCGSCFSYSSWAPFYHEANTCCYSRLPGNTLTCGSSNQDHRRLCMCESVPPTAIPTAMPTLTPVPHPTSLPTTAPVPTDPPWCITRGQECYNGSGEGTCCSGLYCSYDTDNCECIDPDDCPGFVMGVNTSDYQIVIENLSTGEAWEFSQPHLWQSEYVDSDMTMLSPNAWVVPSEIEDNPTPIPSEGPEDPACQTNNDCPELQACNLDGECVSLACSGALDCDDSNECTDDICLNPGQYNASCSNPNKTNDVPCSGGTCSEGVCITLGEQPIDEGGDLNLTLEISFENIPYCEGEICHHPSIDHPLFNGERVVEAEVSLLHATAGSVKQKELFHYDENSKKFVNTTPMIFENISAGPYIIFVKGSMHTATKFCYSGENAANPCTFADLVNANNDYPGVTAGFISLSPGDISLDLSAKPIVVGDLPISGEAQNAQDGKVNVFDYSFMLSCLGNNSRTESCLTRADVDYSSQVNNIDLGLLRKALVEIVDET